jgi:putative SOS response-associated peptidase YedK
VVTAKGDLFGTDRDHAALGSTAGPGRPGQVIWLHPKTGRRNLDRLTWRLRPGPMERSDKAPRPLHARAETAATHPMFADTFRRRRAFVPASEYYLRSTKGHLGQRFAIARRDGQPMATAGLWQAYITPGRCLVARPVSASSRERTAASSVRRGKQGVAATDPRCSRAQATQSPWDSPHGS